MICRSDYYTDTDRRQGHSDRNVWCGLPAGHQGDHDELIDGTIEVVTWPRRASVTFDTSVTIVRTFRAPTVPEIVCLCGSTRFGSAYREAMLRHTLAGRIVLSIGCDLRSDADLAAAGELGEHPAETKRRMDELHKRKIDLADWVYVLNVDGYVGESTASEIAYARSLGKPVLYLESVAVGP